MKILVFDDKPDPLSKRIGKYEVSYGNAVSVVPVLIKKDKTWQSIKQKLRNDKHELDHFDYVFSDVNMPTTVETNKLFLEMRNDGFYVPIILISKDFNNSSIPTNILGLNASKQKDIFRRHYLNEPTLEELKLLLPFTRKDQFLKCFISKTHLIALSILYQGYLAAHETIEPTDGVSISEERKKITEKEDWWKPALEDVIKGTDFKKSKIGKELENVSINSEINQLTEKLKGSECNYFVLGCALSYIDFSLL